MFAVTIEPGEASQNGHCFFSLEVCLSCTVKLEFLNTPENVLLDERGNRADITIDIEDQYMRI